MENSYEAPEAPETSEHLLDDIAGQADLTLASSGQRFFNHLVDYILFYILWRFLIKAIAYPVGMIVVYIGYNRVSLFAVSYLFAAIFEVALFTGMEYFAGGKSLGKLFTKTRAVNEDGTKLTPKTAFLRSVCRIIPFDALSALGNPCHPWHDKLSKTYVIDDAASSLPAIQ